MTATAVLPRIPPQRSASAATRSAANPTPNRTAAAPAATPAAPPATRAVDSQRVLHQLVRRELRLLAELTAWAPPGDAQRTAALTAHAELVGRVLLHHHAVERDRLWPALARALPAGAGDDRERFAAAVADWTVSCARIDHMLRDVATAARQWAVTGTQRARDAYAVACGRIADAVDAQTEEEERTLLPLLGTWLGAPEWTTIARSCCAGLSRRERLFVLGLALEDACAGDRARLLGGLPTATRVAWRLRGPGRYRAAVVRLRGAPPAG